MWYGELLCNGAVVQVIQLKYFCISPVIYNSICLISGPVPMVVPVQVLQIQDVCSEQILAGRHLG